MRTPELDVMLRPLPRRQPVSRILCNGTDASGSALPAGLYNFVVEIPRGVRNKFEIATKEAVNPIKQACGLRGTLLRGRLPAELVAL